MTKEKEHKAKECEGCHLEVAVYDCSCGQRVGHACVEQHRSSGHTVWVPNPESKR
jgi:hypothetical protein